MTAVGYPDIIVLSANGRFRVEARSPDNGTINQRDGSPANTSTFGYTYRQEQRGFRYQLIDQLSSAVVWERWQKKSEGSPHELFVSNDGWVVIRLHGYAYARLIAVSLSGQDAIMVAIGTSYSSEPVEADAVIHDEEVSISTAGLIWTMGSTAYFFRRDARPYFCFVTGWGRRIVLGLAEGRLVSEPRLVPDMKRACIEAERRMVVPSLASTAKAIRGLNRAALNDEDAEPYWRRWPDLESYIALAIRDDLFEALPSLYDLEPLGGLGSSTGCHALPDSLRFWVEMQRVRILLNLAIRHLGGTPAGYACYSFYRHDYKNKMDEEPEKIALSVPECVPSRAAKLGLVSRGMNAQQVLGLLGAPDFRTSFSEPIKRRYIWGEHWHYYTGSGINLAEYRITWKAGSEGSEMAGLGLEAMDKDAVDRRIYESMDQF